MTLCQIQKLRQGEEIIHGVNRQPIQWENIFVRHLSGQVLTSRIYQALQIHLKKK